MRELKISRLTLGTVQFGLNYGVANTSGKPSYETAREIIAKAFEGGVTTFDTAAAYGDSEKVIGKAFADLGIGNHVVPITKTAHKPEDLPDSRIADFYEQSVRSSLSNLNLDVLPLLLMHSETEMPYWEDFLRLRSLGLTRHVGVSIDSISSIETALNLDGVEAIQAPMNILDRRFSGDFLERAKEKGIAVFTRSAFLQGLLVMPTSKITDDFFVEVLPARKALDDIAVANGMDMPELCLRYVVGNSGVDSVLFGVDSLDQLERNLAVFAKGPLPDAVTAEIAAVVPDLPETILRPFLWPRN